MSVKNNAFLAEFLVENPSLTIGDHLVDAQLNDVTVTGGIVFDLLDGSGRAMAMAEVGSDYRPITDTLGNVRIYKTGATAIAALRRLCMGNIQFTYKKKVKAGSAGDPIKALISKYKSCKAEEASAVEKTAEIEAKVAGAEALEWDTAAAGTPENLEYLDLSNRSTVVNQWRVATQNRKTTLEAALTSAGIDLVTLQPVVAGGGEGGGA